MDFRLCFQCDSWRTKLFLISNAGSALVSSGRARSLGVRDDIPSFDLGIDDMEEVEMTRRDDSGIAGAGSIVTTPAVIKLPLKCNQSPRSANKNCSELIIGEMLVIQSEKRIMNEGNVLFGDATPTPAPRRKLPTGDFAPNPFYNGHVHRGPTPEAVTSLFVWVTSQYVKDIERSVNKMLPDRIEISIFVCDLVVVLHGCIVSTAGLRSCIITLATLI